MDALQHRCREIALDGSFVAQRFQHERFTSEASGTKHHRIIRGESPDFLKTLNLVHILTPERRRGLHPDICTS